MLRGMVLLPMVVRELRVRSRRSATVYARVGAAGIVMLIGVLLAVSLRSAGRWVVGSFVYDALAMLLLVFCMVEGARNSAGIICEERREGTLGFLFLTDLSGVDVLLGKLAGAALHAIYAVLATVPVLMLLLLLGGITWAEVFRAAFVCLSALALSLVIGAAVSSIAREPIGSTLISLAVLLVISMGPPVVDSLWQYWSGTGWRPASSGVALVSPVVAMEMGMEPGYSTSPGRFWSGLCLQWAITATIFVASAWFLQQSWRKEVVVARTEAPRETPPARRVGGTPAEVIAASMVSRAGVNRWLVAMVALDFLPNLGQWVLTRGMTATGGVSFILFVPLILAWLGAQLLAAHLTVRLLGETVRSGEMEILLTTPMDAKELVSLIWRSLRRIAVWMTICSAVEAGITLTIAAWNGLPNPPFQFIWQVASQAGGVAATAACYSALVWIGMWQGLVRRSMATAVAWTVGIVSVLVPILGIVAQAVMSLALAGTTLGPNPTMVISLMALAPALVRIALYVGWISWARQLLYRHFREAASGIHAAS